MSSIHCFLCFCTENRSICHGVVSSEFLTSYTFQQKCYISIAHTGNVIIYVPGPNDPTCRSLVLFVCFSSEIWS